MECQVVLAALNLLEDDTTTSLSSKAFLETYSIEENWLELKKEKPLLYRTHMLMIL